MDVVTNPEVVLDQIAFQPDLDALLHRLRVREGSEHAASLKEFALQAKEVARPKAAFKMCFIESKGDKEVVVDGVRLKSRVLRVNLENVNRVFVTVATCGQEMESWSRSVEGTLERYWADTLCEMALRGARVIIRETISQRFQTGPTSSMHPGALEDWPLSEQLGLFKLLGDLPNAIGVQLKETLLMLPTKSISGIRFPTKVNFTSCQLCPRENCPGRKAPFDDTLYARKYRLSITRGPSKGA